jgi:2-polyprenyl-6-methoxyphenol hydroxylase-like FAD-dependent oxidoreductase
MDRRCVLIVGGGIAGLALAPMLARTGVAVELIERAPAWQPAGTGMYLPGNGFDGCERLDRPVARLLRMRLERANLTGADARNLFTKLGLSSRAAATAYAYEHDLV